MKKNILFLGFGILILQCSAQDASLKTLKNTALTATAADTALKRSLNGWAKGINFSLSLTQVSNSNWIAAGGDNFSFSTAASLNAFASRKWGKKVGIIFFTWTLDWLIPSL